MRITFLSSFCIIVCLGVIPPLSMAYFGASSAAFGLVLSLMLVLIYYAKNLTVLQRIPKLLLLLIFVIMLHSAILHAQLHFLDSRACISFFLFIFVISMAFFLSKVILIGGLDADQSFKYVFIVLFSLAISAYATEFKLGEIFYGYHKAIFPFGEPSHFALFFGPLFLLYLFQSTNIWKQIFVVLAVALLAILIESTTLLIYVALALLLLVRINTVSLFLVVPVSIYGVYYVLNDPYFLSRIILSPDSDNLTALVYLQGLQDAHYSFISTNGIGLGFQMLGTQPMSIAGEQIATLMNGSTLNRQDGGFLAAKIIAEFGLLGIIFLLLYLYLLVNVYFKLREAIKNRYQFSYVYLFSLAFIYSSCVEFFVRGVGYFSPSLFLFLVAIFIYYHFKKNASAKFHR